MAKAKKKKSMLGFVCLALVAICAILAIVGVTQDWTVGKFADETVGGTTLADYKEIADMADKMNIEDSKAGTMVALGYLAVAAVCVTAAAYVVKQLFSFTLFRVIVILLGVITMAAGVAAVAYTAANLDGLSLSASDGFWGEVWGDNGLFLGIGCILTSVGAIAGGLFAAVGCFKR